MSPLVRPLLKSLHSADVYDLKTYRPTDPRKFGFAVQALIGTLGDDGEESFELTICSPNWLVEHIGSGVFMGRHYLFLNEYDFEKINNFLHQYINGITGETWDAVAQRLSRLGHWEFEDYVEFED